MWDEVELEVTALVDDHQFVAFPHYSEEDRMLAEEDEPVFVQSPDGVFETQMPSIIGGGIPVDKSMGGRWVLWADRSSSRLAMQPLGSVRP